VTLGTIVELLAINYYTTLHPFNGLFSRQPGKPAPER